MFPPKGFSSLVYHMVWNKAHVPYVAQDFKGFSLLFLPHTKDLLYCTQISQVTDPHPKL